MRYVPGGRPRPHALRWLAEHHLGLAIQGGAHSPIDDARAALYLYHMHRKVGPFANSLSEWELGCLFGLERRLRGRVSSGAAQLGRGPLSHQSVYLYHDGRHPTSGCVQKCKARGL